MRAIPQAGLPIATGRILVDCTTDLYEMILPEVPVFLLRLASTCKILHATLPAML